MANAQSLKAVLGTGCEDVLHTIAEFLDSVSSSQPQDCTPEIMANIYASMKKCLDRPLHKYNERAQCILSLVQYVASMKQHQDGLHILLDHGLIDMMSEVLLSSLHCARDRSDDKSDKYFEEILDTIVRISEYSTRSKVTMMEVFCDRLLQVIASARFRFSTRMEGLRSVNQLLDNCPRVSLDRLREVHYHNELVKNVAIQLETIGDFDFQAAVIELIFRLVTGSQQRQNLAEKWFSSEIICEEFAVISDAEFEKDIRVFLNNLNTLHCESNVLVYSIPCVSIYLGSFQLMKPTDSEQFWVDFNTGSERISIFCTQAFPDSQEEDDAMWETVSVWKNSLHQYRITEKGGMVVIDLRLNGNVFDLITFGPSQQAEHTVTIMFQQSMCINLMAAIQQTLGTEKAVGKCRNEKASISKEAVAVNETADVRRNLNNSYTDNVSQLSQDSLMYSQESQSRRRHRTKASCAEHAVVIPRLDSEPPTPVSQTLPERSMENTAVIKPRMKVSEPITPIRICTPPSQGTYQSPYPVLSEATPQTPQSSVGSVKRTKTPLQISGGGPKAETNWTKSPDKLLPQEDNTCPGSLAIPKNDEVTKHKNPTTKLAKKGKLPKATKKIQNSESCEIEAELSNIPVNRPNPSCKSDNDIAENDKTKLKQNDEVVASSCPDESHMRIEEAVPYSQIVNTVPDSQKIGTVPDSQPVTIIPESQCLPIYAPDRTDTHIEEGIDISLSEDDTNDLECSQEYLTKGERRQKMKHLKQKLVSMDPKYIPPPINIYKVSNTPCLSTVSEEGSTTPRSQRWNAVMPSSNKSGPEESPIPVSNNGTGTPLPTIKEVEVCEKIVANDLDVQTAPPSPDSTTTNTDAKKTGKGRGRGRGRGKRQKDNQQLTEPQPGRHATRATRSKRGANNLPEMFSDVQDEQINIEKQETKKVTKPIKRKRNNYTDKSVLENIKDCSDIVETKKQPNENSIQDTASENMQANKKGNQQNHSHVPKHLQVRDDENHGIPFDEISSNSKKQGNSNEKLNTTKEINIQAKKKCDNPIEGTVVCADSMVMTFSDDENDIYNDHDVLISQVLEDISEVLPDINACGNKADSIDGSNMTSKDDANSDKANTEHDNMSKPNLDPSIFDIVDASGTVDVSSAIKIIPVVPDKATASSEISVCNDTEKSNVSPPDSPDFDMSDEDVAVPCGQTPRADYEPENLDCSDLPGACSDDDIETEAPCASTAMTKSQSTKGISIKNQSLKNKSKESDLCVNQIVKNKQDKTNNAQKNTLPNKKTQNDEYKKQKGAIDTKTSSDKTTSDPGKNTLITDQSLDGRSTKTQGHNNFKDSAGYGDDMPKKNNRKKSLGPKTTQCLYAVNEQWNDLNTLCTPADSSRKSRAETRENSVADQNHHDRSVRFHSVEVNSDRNLLRDMVVTGRSKSSDATPYRNKTKQDSTKTDLDDMKNKSQCHQNPVRIHVFNNGKPLMFTPRKVVKPKKPKKQEKQEKVKSEHDDLESSQVALINPGFHLIDSPSSGDPYKFICEPKMKQSKIKTKPNATKLKPHTNVKNKDPFGFDEGDSDNSDAVIEESQTCAALEKRRCSDSSLNQSQPRFFKHRAEQRNKSLDTEDTNIMKESIQDIKLKKNESIQKVKPQKKNPKFKEKKNNTTCKQPQISSYFNSSDASSVNENDISPSSPLPNQYVAGSPEMSPVVMLEDLNRGLRESVDKKLGSEHIQAKRKSTNKKQVGSCAIKTTNKILQKPEPRYTPKNKNVPDEDINIEVLSSNENCEANCSYEGDISSVSLCHDDVDQTPEISKKKKKKKRQIFSETDETSIDMSNTELSWLNSTAKKPKPKPSFSYRHFAKGPRPQLRVLAASESESEAELVINNRVSSEHVGRCTSNQNKKRKPFTNIENIPETVQVPPQRTNQPQNRKKRKELNENKPPGKKVSRKAKKNAAIFKDVNDSIDSVEKLRLDDSLHPTPYLIETSPMIRVRDTCANASPLLPGMEESLPHDEYDNIMGDVDSMCSALTTITHTAHIPSIKTPKTPAAKLKKKSTSQKNTPTAKLSDNKQSSGEESHRNENTTHKNNTSIQDCDTVDDGERGLNKSKRTVKSKNNKKSIQDCSMIGEADIQNHLEEERPKKIKSNSRHKKSKCEQKMNESTSNHEEDSIHTDEETGSISGGVCQSLDNLIKELGQRTQSRKKKTKSQRLDSEIMVKDVHRKTNKANKNKSLDECETFREDTGEMELDHHKISDKSKDKRKSNQMHSSLVDQDYGQDLEEDIKKKVSKKKSKLQEDNVKEIDGGLSLNDEDSSIHIEEEMLSGDSMGLSLPVLTPGGMGHSLDNLMKELEADIVSQCSAYTHISDIKTPLTPFNVKMMEVETSEDNADDEDEEHNEEQNKSTKDTDKQSKKRPHPNLDITDTGIKSGPSKRRKLQDNTLIAETVPEMLEEEEEETPMKSPESLSDSQLRPRQLFPLTSPSLAMPLEESTTKKRPKQAAKDSKNAVEDEIVESFTQESTGHSSTQKSSSNESSSGTDSGESDMDMLQNMVSAPHNSFSSKTLLSSMGRLSGDYDDVDIGLQTGIASMLGSFGKDMNRTMNSRRDQLNQLTRNTLKSTQKEISRIWQQEKKARDTVMSSFHAMMEAELKGMETDVINMTEAENKSLAFFQHHLKQIQGSRTAQEQRMKRISAVEQKMKLQMQQVEKHESKLPQVKELLRKEMTSLQKSILQKSHQAEMSNVKKTLQGIFV